MYICRNCGLQYSTDEAVMCVRCRAPRGMGNQFCSCCGVPTQPQQKVCMNCGVEVEKYGRPTGRKSKALAGVFGIMWGAFGVHNFYLGYITKAIIQLTIAILSFVLYMVGIFGLELGSYYNATGYGIAVLLGFIAVFGVAIWGWVEGIMILCGKIDRDGKGFLLRS